MGPAQLKWKGMLTMLDIGFASCLDTSELSFVRSPWSGARPGLAVVGARADPWFISATRMTPLAIIEARLYLAHLLMVLSPSDHQPTTSSVVGVPRRQCKICDHRR